jgi:hypothetical protein
MVFLSGMMQLLLLFADMRRHPPNDGNDYTVGKMLPVTAARDFASAWRGAWGMTAAALATHRLVRLGRAVAIVAAILLARPDHALAGRMGAFCRRSRIRRSLIGSHVRILLACVTVDAIQAQQEACHAVRGG